MGAKSSTEFGSIGIKTDKPSYFQGEYLTGTIFLNILKEFNGNEVIFKLKGKEDAYWSEGVGTKKYLYSAKRVIISHQFPLFLFTQKKIPYGQFAFPFSVYLHPNLPASFVNEFGITSSIKYKIKGELKSSNKNSKSMKNSVELKLKQAKNDLYAPPITKLSVTVDSCCFSRGLTEIETKVNKTAYLEGEIATLQCSIDNSKCKLKLVGVNLIFQRRLALKSNGGHLNLTSQNIQSRANRLDIPKNHGTPVISNFEIPIKSFNENKLLTSTLGVQIRNTYFLIIEPIYESLCCQCCTKNVETPILVYEASDAYIQQLQAPNDWSPEIMPIQNFNWNQGESYQGKNTGGFEYPKLDKNQMNVMMNDPGIPNNNGNFNNNVGEQYGMNQNNNFGVQNNGNGLQQQGMDGQRLL